MANIPVSEYKLSALPASSRIGAHYYIPNGNGTDLDHYIGLATGFLFVGSRPATDIVLEYATVSAFPVTGADNIIYVVTSGADINKLYRWNGSAYVQIGGGSLISSTSSLSKYLFDIASDIASFDGATFRNEINKNTQQPIYIPLSFFSNSLIPSTRQGTALPSVTPVAHGPYERWVVTGGGSGDRIDFTSIFHADGNGRWRFKALVNTKNATSPFFGWRGRIPASGGPYTNNIATFDATSNLLTYAQTTTGGSTTNYDGGFAVSNGDIIESIIDFDFNKAKITNTLINHTTGTWKHQRKLNATLNSSGKNVHNPSIVFSDMDITPLEISFSTKTKEGVKLAVIGDSMGSGYNITGAVNLTGQFEATTPYQSVLIGSPGTYMAGIVRSHLPEVIRCKAQAVVIFNFLSMADNAHDAGDPDNAAWIDGITKICKGVLSYGGKPIMVKVPATWALAGFNNAYTVTWNAWVDANAGAYGYLILDVSDIPFTYDSSVYHPDAAWYTLCLTRLITLMEANSLL